MDMDMDMTMTFDWSIKTKILFDFWDVHTWPIYILSLVIVFAATVGAEALNTMLARCEARVSGNRQPLLGRSSLSANGDNAEERTLAARLPLAALFALRQGVALLLMLVAMTYNVGLFLAIVAGYFTGYALFGHKRASSPSSCC